ncbi:hypothetical protein EV2_035396 [Malus domestica]
MNHVELHTTQLKRMHQIRSCMLPFWINETPIAQEEEENTCISIRITFFNLQQHWKTTDAGPPNKIRNYAEPDFCTVDGGVVRERPPTSKNKQP